MSGRSITNAGLQIFIGSSPGASTATILIDGVDDIGEFGIEQSVKDVTSLSDRWKRKLKGVRDGGKMTISGQFRSGDQGQAMLRTAVRASGSYPFQIVFPDTQGTNPTSYTLYAQVLTYKPNPGKVDGIIMFKADLEVDGAVTGTMAA